MKFVTMNAIAIIITGIIALWYCISKIIKWDKKYKKEKIDISKIEENIKNNRRPDWGVSSEVNWKNTWNPNNPKKHKWLEYVFILIKSAILIYVIHRILLFTLVIVNTILVSVWQIV